jgi:hypothetical protein
MKIDWPVKGQEWGAMVEEGKAWEILIADWLPSSFNSLLRNSWTTYVGERRFIQRYLSDNYREIPPAMGKREIQIVIIKTSGQWDDEPNLDGRSKATLDAMTKLAMLRDDNRKWLKWNHVQEVHGTIKGVAIRLWEVE